MFVLLRTQLKVSGIAAFIAGLVFMFSMPDISDNPLLFLPLMFILAHKWVNTKKFLWMFILAIVVSLYFLNANPQYVIYFCVFLYIYIFISFLLSKEKANSGDAFYTAIKSCFPFIIGFGLSSFRVLPMLEMLGISHRGTMSTVSYMLPPPYFIHLLYPKFYLSSFNPELNFFSGRILNGIASFLVGPERLNFGDGPYVGILPFILALIVIIKKNKSPLEKFFAYSSLIVLLYVIFNPLLQILIRHIPLLNKMPFVYRSYIIYNFSMAILAAFAVESLLKKTFELAKIRKLFYFLSIFLLFIILLRATIQFVLAKFGPQIISVLANKILPSILKQSFYQASADFYHNRLRQLIAFLQGWANPFNEYFLIPTIFFIASLILLYFCTKRKFHKNLFVILATIVVFVDLLFNFAIPACSTKELIVPLGVADFINKQPGVFRAIPLLQNYDTKNPPPMNVRTFLRPESNMIYNIMTAEGYRSLYLDRYADIIELLTGQPAQSLKVKIGEFDRIDDRIADLLNIKYIVTFPDKDMPKGYREVYKDKTHKIFLNEDALSRAILVHRVKIEKQKGQLLNILKSSVNFRETVVLEEEVTGFKEDHDSSSSGQSKVIMESYEPNSVDISVENPRDGFLVLLDCYYPGWKAYLDDKPTDIFKADYIFRAVRVPKGKHLVKFSYQPDSLRIGLLISFAFFSSGIVLSFFLRKKAF
jgi:hypothetical protein